jgi:hypothetical protein
MEALMAKRIVGALVGTLFLLGAGSASAQPRQATDLGDNAALRYWQAFAHLPPRDKDQEKMLVEWNKTPLDATARKLIEAGTASLHSLHRGTTIRRCDWGLDYDEGPLLLLPHLERARTLTLLACLRARAHFEDGKTSQGVDDAVAVLALGRQVACERTALIACLVQYLIERHALDVLAMYLPKLGNADLQRLAGLLDTLPPSGLCRNSMSIEKDEMLNWFIKRLQTRKESWREDVAQLFADREQSDAFLKSVEPATPERLMQLLKELAPLYDEMAALLDLPPDQFAGRWDAFEKKARTANPVARFLLPAMHKAMAAEQAAQTRFALFKAALAVAQGGPEKLKAIRDPFGDGPFEYRKSPQGFELKSKLIYKELPVTLTVGPKDP